MTELRASTTNDLWKMLYDNKFDPFAAESFRYECPSHEPIPLTAMAVGALRSMENDTAYVRNLRNL